MNQMNGSNCAYFPACFKHILLIGHVRNNPRFCPTPKVGTSKYGPNGMYTGKGFEQTGLSYRLCEQLAIAANYSLSCSTWGCYKTIRSHLERYQRDLKVQFNFPMTNSQVLCFLA